MAYVYPAQQAGATHDVRFSGLFKIFIRGKQVVLQEDSVRCKTYISAANTEEMQTYHPASS
jgi:hypothetical protein